MKDPVEVILKRQLQCESFRLIMTVSRFEKQNEILAILKLFVQYGTLTRSTVNRELLKLPDDSYYGENILITLESYGLIKRVMEMKSYALTETGQGALQMKKIPYPTRELFEVVISKDILLSCKILKVNEQDGATYRVNKGEGIKKLPTYLTEIMGRWVKKTLTLPAGNMKRLSITDFSQTGEETTNDFKFEISMVLKYGEKPVLSLKDKSPIRIDFETDLTSFDILKELLDKQGELIDRQGPVLLLETKGLSIPELRNFSKNFTLSEPFLKQYGTFQTVTVNSLRIFPSSQSEAVQWAWRLVLDEMNHYIGKKEYNDLVKNVCERFEPYNVQTLIKSIPDYGEILKRARSGDKELKNQYWYIVAPRDLSPRRSINDRN